MGRQFVVFGGVGLINTLISLTIIMLLSDVWGVHYLLANVIGYLVGLMLGFYLHKYITFSVSSKLSKTKVQFIKFLGVFAAAYIVQLVFVGVAVGEWGWPNILAQAVGAAIYVLISFLGNRILTFRAPKSS